MACHAISETVLVLVTWLIGFFILGCTVAAITWLDNRLAQRNASDAPASEEKH